MPKDPHPIAVKSFLKMSIQNCAFNIQSNTEEPMEIVQGTIEIEKNVCFKGENKLVMKNGPVFNNGSQEPFPDSFKASLCVPQSLYHCEGNVGGSQLLIIEMG